MRQLFFRVYSDAGRLNLGLLETSIISRQLREIPATPAEGGSTGLVGIRWSRDPLNLRLLKYGFLVFVDDHSASSFVRRIRQNSELRLAAPEAATKAESSSKHNVLDSLLDPPRPGSRPDDTAVVQIEVSDGTQDSRPPQSSRMPDLPLHMTASSPSSYGFSKLFHMIYPESGKKGGPSPFVIRGALRRQSFNSLRKEFDGFYGKAHPSRWSRDGRLVHAGSSNKAEEGSSERSPENPSPPAERISKDEARDDSGITESQPENIEQGGQSQRNEEVIPLAS